MVAADAITVETMRDWLKQIEGFAASARAATLCYEQFSITLVELKREQERIERTHRHLGITGKNQQEREDQLGDLLDGDPEYRALAERVEETRMSRASEEADLLYYQSMIRALTALARLSVAD